jgi:hypothetical protein
MELSANGRPDLSALQSWSGRPSVANKTGRMGMAEPTALRTNNEAPKNNRPRMLAVIECFDTAFEAMTRANQILGSIMLDIEKGSDWMVKFRDGLVATIEGAGGDVTQAVEGQIRDFIGNKKYQQPQTTEGN